LLFVFCRIRNRAKSICLRENLSYNSKVYFDRCFSIVVLFVLCRLTVGSGFGSNFGNRPDPTVPTLGIDPKPESVPTILEPTRPDPTRFSIPKLGIDPNCQEPENYVITPRITIFSVWNLNYLINYYRCYSGCLN